MSCGRFHAKYQSSPPGSLILLIPMLLNKNIWSCLLLNLYIDEVSIPHRFELLSPTHNYRVGFNCTLWQSQILPHWTDNILRAEIIKPAVFSGCASIIIVSKMTWKTLFSFNYGALKGCIKPNQWPILHIEDSFDDLRRDSRLLDVCILPTLPANRKALHS